MSKKKSIDKKAAQVKTTPADGPDSAFPQESTAEGFPIVGLGASAGGLEALKSFFSEVSEDSAMAYIVLVHLPPKQPSMMPELLQRIARIPVSAARDGEVIEPNHVYVIPPDKEITVYKGRIQLMDFVKRRAPLPIDSFLSSLALDQGRNAAAIILSGTGTDGTLGVKEIKANDGLVLVQSAESAGYDGMPRSALNTGLADMVLAPEEMPKRLNHYFRHSRASSGRGHATAAAATDQQEWLNKIFAVLRARVGHDFSAYKVSTILRRIDRRMGLNQIKSHETYVRYLRENPGEVEVLFRELLIGVTNFFRDPESFEVLKNRILPKVLKQMQKGATFRAWIPGCSTGEEVYS
ncbi:MAG: chemotaxis protein CheB, partial [Desulfobacterales bacterium]